MEPGNSPVCGSLKLASDEKTFGFSLRPCEATGRRSVSSGSKQDDLSPTIAAASLGQFSHGGNRCNRNMGYRRLPFDELSFYAGSHRSRLKLAELYKAVGDGITEKSPPLALLRSAVGPTSWPLSLHQQTYRGHRSRGVVDPLQTFRAHRLRHGVRIASCLIGAGRSRDRRSGLSLLHRSCPCLTSPPIPS